MSKFMLEFRERVLRHSWSTPTLATLCLTVVLGAMGTVSVVVLKMERAQDQAAQEAALEENVRLALWRLDSALAPIIAEELARPSYAYKPFYAPERAYSPSFDPIRYGEVLIPSPLLTFDSPRVILHFQVEPDGRITSPEIPEAHMRAKTDWMLPDPASHDKVIAEVKNFERLKSILTRRKIELALENPPAGVPATQPAAGPRPGEVNPLSGLAAGREGSVAAGIKSQVEYSQRQQNNAMNIANQRQDAGDAGSAAETKPDDGFQSIWIDNNLFLVRRVREAGQTTIQGCWLDWDAIRPWLLGQVHDLLPRAELLPAGDAHHNLSRRLAALPISVIPGPLPEVSGPIFSWLRVSLLFLWTGLILAALAGAILLRGALLLSERRAAFVSAVTHELRTPLTTFRLYSQMLSNGMVRDPDQQALYLKTLESEADRLAHLVENVLAYARLERTGPVGEGQPIRLDQLLSGMADRLGQRAVQSGMTLVTDIPPELAGLELQAEPAGVEQTLFNLVDNACKYAATASDRRIHLEASRRRKQLILCIRDHGPGLSADVRDRLFLPFSKSAQVAAGSTPGVGLGLALALRYARHMGGDLTLERATDQGACFAMSLHVVG